MNCLHRHFTRDCANKYADTIVGVVSPPQLDCFRGMLGDLLKAEASPDRNYVLRNAMVQAGMFDDTTSSDPVVLHVVEAFAKCADAVSPTLLLCSTLRLTAPCSVVLVQVANACEAKRIQALGGTVIFVHGEGQITGQEAALARQCDYTALAVSGRFIERRKAAELFTPWNVFSSRWKPRQKTTLKELSTLAALAAQCIAYDHELVQ